MSNKPKNILFRADSSSTIGTGHIMRDLVLASQLQKQYPKAKIFFATQNLDGNINHKISEAGYEILDLKTNQADELLEVLETLHVEMIVIDHYEIDYSFEKQLKIRPKGSALGVKNPTLKIMVLDDTYEKHKCDILLNHNISANKKRYKDLVPKNCEIRCGSTYTLLREEFYKEKKKLQQRKKFKIFLAMGGADHSNLNIKILKVLKQFANIKVNLVTTTANQNLQELQKYIQNKPWINLQINSTEIAKLMRKSDLAIVTPSVTLNEVFFMEISFIAIKTADNQEDMYKYLVKNNYPVLKKFDTQNLLESLKQRDDLYGAKTP